MIDIKKKKYIEDELVNLSNEEVLRFLSKEKEKEVSLYALYALMFYKKELDTVQILNNVQLTNEDYLCLLKYSADKGLLEYYEYFLNHLENIDFENALFIIYELIECDSLEEIKLTLDKVNLKNNFEKLDEYFFNSLFYDNVDFFIDLIIEKELLSKAFIKNISKINNKKAVEIFKLKNKLIKF